jgi:hypothetical protein
LQPTESRLLLASTTLTRPRLRLVTFVAVSVLVVARPHARSDQLAVAEAIEIVVPLVRLLELRVAVVVDEGDVRRRDCDFTTLSVDDHSALHSPVVDTRGYDRRFRHWCIEDPHLLERLSQLAMRPAIVGGAQRPGRDDFLLERVEVVGDALQGLDDLGQTVNRAGPTEVAKKAHALVIHTREADARSELVPEISKEGSTKSRAVHAIANAAGPVVGATLDALSKLWHGQTAVGVAELPVTGLSSVVHAVSDAKNGIRAINSMSDREPVMLDGSDVTQFNTAMRALGVQSIDQREAMANRDKERRANAEALAKAREDE